MNVLVVHVTVTVVTFADRFEPLPFVTAQVCPTGCVVTLTVQLEPASSAVVNVKLPLAENVCCCVLVGFVPSSSSCTEPVRPLMLPPMV